MHDIVDKLLTCLGPPRDEFDIIYYIRPTAEYPSCCPKETWPFVNENKHIFKDIF